VRRRGGRRIRLVREIADFGRRASIHFEFIFFIFAIFYFSSLGVMADSLLVYQAALEKRNAALEKGNTTLAKEYATLEKKYATLKKKYATLEKKYTTFEKGKEDFQSELSGTHRQGIAASKNATSSLPLGDMTTFEAMLSERKPRLDSYLEAIRSEVNAEFERLVAMDKESEMKMRKDKGKKRAREESGDVDDADSGEGGKKKGQNSRNDEGSDMKKRKDKGKKRAREE
jgi:cell division protein FtsB